MKKGILFVGILALVTFLTSISANALSYIYFTGINFANENDTYTYTLDKDDFSSQYVKNESYDSIFKSSYSGKIRGSIDGINICETTYATLPNNVSREFIGCASNPYSGNKTDLTIKITKKGWASSTFNGWWAAKASLAQ